MGVGSGRKSKQRRHDRKMKEKAARKAAQRAYYESLRDAGRNSKSKRFMSHSKKNTVKVKETRVVQLVRAGRLVSVERRVHGGPDCGNIGCIRCSPLAARAA